MVMLTPNTGPSSCHQLYDHSKMKCLAITKQKCASGHSQSWQCFQGNPVSCNTCEREKKIAEKKAKRALEDQTRREEMKKKHLNEMAKLDDEIEKLIQSMQNTRLETDQAAVLAQKRKDLEAAQTRARNVFKSNSSSGSDELLMNRSPVAKPSEPADPSGPPKSNFTARVHLQKHIKSAVDHNSSASKTEWQRQKDQENASNPAIDDIMAMIGLEDVKLQVLKIKSKVETSIRQNTDLKRERLGLVLLGNPGTGMCARLIRSKPNT